MAGLHDGKGNARGCPGCLENALRRAGISVSLPKVRILYFMECLFLTLRRASFILVSAKTSS